MNTVYGLSDAQASGIASVLAGQAKVKIAKGDGWRYSFDKNTVYYDDRDLWYLTTDEFIANIMHEVGHALYSREYTKLRDGLRKKFDNDDHWNKLFKLNNALEDFRIEDKLRKFYPHGSDYLPEYGFKVHYNLSRLFDSYLNKTDENGNPVPVPKYVQYCWLMYCRVARVVINRDIDKDVVDKVDLTEEYGVQARLAKTPQELTNIIVEKIYPHIKEYLDEFKDEQGGGCCLQGSGAATMGGDDAEDSEDESVKKARRLGGYGSSVTNGEPIDIFMPSYNEMFNEVKPLISKTTQSLERILINKKESDYVGKFRTGQKLNARRLYQFIKDNPRLFDRRYEKKQKKYIFNLVVDMSGSMALDSRYSAAVDTYYSGRSFSMNSVKDEVKESKIYTATKTAILFANVLSKMNIPYVVSGFNSKIFFYSNYGDSLNTKTKKNFELMLHEAYHTHRAVGDCGTNNDADAVHFNAKKLESVGGDYQKVMVVLSDGSPAYSYDALFHNLSHEVKNAESKGIDVIGIGIEDHSVETYYDHNFIINNAEELPAKMVALLKTKLKKKGD